VVIKRLTEDALKYKNGVFKMVKGAIKLQHFLMNRAKFVRVKKGNVD